MNLLAVDTTGPVMSAALRCGNSPITEKIRAGAWGHMEELLPFIDELLRGAKIKIGDIDAFLINRGPGSFTGLRIGFSSLLGFLAAEPKPCFGACALDLTAERIPCGESNHLAVCLDAFRSKFYVQNFENKNNEWVPSSPAAALEISAALDSIPRGACIAGHALDRFKNLFEDAKKDFRFAAQEYWSPHASSLIRLYEKKSSAVKKLVSSEDFLPVYLRMSEPEERKAELKIK